MIRFDRFVIHVDNDESVFNQLKNDIEPLGFPTDLSLGKSTQALATTNIWIGKQNLEIVQLLQPNVTGWNEDWVSRYNQGERGIFGLFITTRNLDNLHENMVERNLQVSSPRQPGVKDFLGLVGELLGLSRKGPHKASSLRYLALPPIPGSGFQLCFVEYDPRAEEELQVIRQPNSTENGITGIHRAKLYLPLWDEGIEFLQTVFPKLEQAKSQYKVELKEAELLFFRSTPEDGLKLKLEASCESKTYTRSRFAIENVEVRSTST